MPGDSLESIAGNLNSTVADIQLLNKTILTNGNMIYPGQLLVVRINLVTPMPTVTSTATATITP
jgi:LysM repeat protein